MNGTGNHVRLNKPGTEGQVLHDLTHGEAKKIDLREVGYQSLGTAVG
jgi:hypothetical protein